MEAFDTPIRSLFNCQNGTIHLKGIWHFTLMHPEDKLTKISDVLYDNLEAQL